MSTTRTIQTKMSYVDSSETRNYNINDVYPAMDFETVRTNTRNFNQYLVGAVSAPVFVSPTGKAGKAITEVKIVDIQETAIEGV